MLQPSLSALQSGESLDGLAILKLIFWTNWSLMLINLLPVFPFDGGRSLHAVTQFFWPESNTSQTLLGICRLGKVVSAMLLLFACFKHAQPEMWLALSTLSIYIFFYSRREELQHAEVEREEDTVFGYDFSQGYTSLERSLEEHEGTDQPVPAPRQNLFARWMEQRREAKRERERKQEADDERRVDEVLGRLHQHGMRSLSQDDRALLDRVSKRYRSRMSS